MKNNIGKLLRYYGMEWDDSEVCASEILDLFSVMLSEAKSQAITHKAFKYDNNIYDKPITDAYEHALYIMEDRIKDKIHSA